MKVEAGVSQNGGLWSAASVKKGACAGSQSGAPRKRRYSWLPLLLLTFLLALLPSLVLAQEGGTNRAGLIVIHGDGRVLTRCVTFTEERISGVALLQRSGLAVDANTGPMGSAVCTINLEGCPVNDCFCQCKNNPCTYWNYFHRNADGSWAYSGMGAATWTVGNGDIDGWVWGDGSVSPPALAFDAICGAESAPVAPPAALSTVAPTATPIPPETPISTPTALPATLPPSTTPTSPSASPTAVSATSTVTPTPSPAPTPPLSPSPTHPLTYTLSFPVVSSPATSSYRAPSPLRQYIPYALLLICIVGLALLKRKPK